MIGVAINSDNQVQLAIAIEVARSHGSRGGTHVHKLRRLEGPIAVARQ